MANGRGTYSAGRFGAGARWGLLAAGLAVAVFAAVMPAGADSPESGADPSVTLTVTPDDALSDGQQVFVSGTGFPGLASGLIRQCGGSVAVPECDTILLGTFITDSSGNFASAPMTVNRIITTFTTTYNCGAQPCALVADAGGKSSRHHVAFAAAGTIPGSTTTPPTTIGGATTVPPTTAPGATTVPPPTTIPGATTVPPPTENVLCVIVRALGEAIPALLGGLADFLLRLLGCAPLNS